MFLSVHEKQCSVCIKVSESRMAWTIRLAIHRNDCMSSGYTLSESLPIFTVAQPKYSLLNYSLLNYTFMNCSFTMYSLFFILTPELYIHSWTIYSILNYILNHELYIRSWTIYSLLNYIFIPELYIRSWTINSIMNYTFDHELYTHSWTIYSLINYILNHELYIHSWTVCILFIHPWTVALLLFTLMNSTRAHSWIHVWFSSMICTLYKNVKQHLDARLGHCSIFGKYFHI